MMEKEQSHKKGFRYKWLIALVSVAALIVSVRATLKSDWLFDKIKNIALEQVNKQINGSLSARALHGDLLNGFTIHALELKDLNDQEIAKIDSIQIGYSFFDLIRSPHEVNQVAVWGAQSYLKQDQNSDWNILSLIQVEEAHDDSESDLYWSINSISLHDINIFAESEELFPDGFLNVIHLNSSLSAGVNGNGFYGDLKALEFNLEEARLPESVAVYLAAQAAGDKYTLESLVINTGRSVFNSNASLAGDRINAESSLTPLSWQDLLAYSEDLPLRQNLDIQISAEGTLSRAKISLSASSNGLSSFKTKFDADFTSGFKLNSLNIVAENFDGQTLLGLDETLTFSRFNYIGLGSLFFDNPESSEWVGEFSVDDFAAGNYEFDQFISDYSLAGAELSIGSTIYYSGEQINSLITARNVWGDIPSWNIELNGDQINLATWTKDSALESRLSIVLVAEGEGIDTDDLSARSSVEVRDGRFGDQTFSELTFSGNLDNLTISGFLTAKLIESELVADFKLDRWQEQTPGYEFDIELKRFNASELTGLENFPTHLNGKLTGSGESFDPKTLQLFAKTSFDSSFVNGEEIQTLRAGFTIQNSTVIIDEALLESPIADASFTAKQHLFELTKPDNQFIFSATLKDLQPIAPLLGVELIQSQGRVEGQLTRGEAGLLTFSSGMELSNTIVDSLFMSEKITGSVTALLREEPEVDIEIDVTKPVISNIRVQDIALRTNATIGDLEQYGSIWVSIINDEESSLVHGGEFRLASERVLIDTNLLDLTTGLRTLSLVKPFTTTYENGVVKMDTLSIQSPGENAFMSMWISHLDTLKQQIGLNAKNLNLGAIQSMAMDSPYFEGLLSGSVELDNDPGYLTVNGSGIFSDVRYESGVLDTLQFEIDIMDEWLAGGLNAIHENKKLLEGSIRVPFLPGDPLTFDSEFFDWEIDGSFKVFDSDLTYWLSFLPENEIQDTEGVISIDSRLKGLAGKPKLDGNLAIREARLSGISVDSLGFDMMYLHENEEIEFEGYVVSLQRPIIDFDARVPFKVDLRQAEVLLPSDEDIVNVNLRTENFDLAIFNDFLDRDVVRQLSGRLNGNVTLNGKIADLQPTGRMELSDGSIRVVQAGITLTEIGSIINFEPNRIQLHQFSMRSGPGRIRASGFAEIENLVPGNIQVDIRGNQFRAANTSEYNATLDLTANLRGTFLKPQISGNLVFLNGFVNLQNFGERAVEDVQLDDEEEPEPIDFYDAMAIDMNVRFTRQFFIRNRQFLDMEIELGGDVDLVKESYNDLQMFGSLEGVRGYARPLGKNFVLDDALISFFGPIDNPELNVRTRYEPPQAQSDVRIFYVIEGTVQSPEFRFESEPQLELQDIISYTLFGKPFYELESWEQVVAGSGSGPTATDLALDVLLDRVEMLASQRLGIDVVQIDNSRSGSNSTTSITTGWYLNRRTFFAILNEISSTRPKTLFLIEYMLTENLELMLLQGDDSREGIDLRWNYDY